MVIESYTLRVYQGATLVGSVPIAASSVASNMTPPTFVPAPGNPQYLWWADPANPGKMCRVGLSTSLDQLAAGSYTAKLTAHASGLASPESNAASFDRLGPPPAPTGVAFQ